MDKLLKIFSFCIVSTILTSCVTMPPLILQLPETTKSISLESTELKSAIGQTVRWGGVIIETKNNKDKAQIMILAYPLDNQARPDIYNYSGGRRFIANFNHTLELSQYSHKTEITVIGKFDLIEQNKIGEFNYEFPVVSVEKHALWQNQRYYTDESNYNYNEYLWFGYSPYFYPYFGIYDRHHFHPYFY